MLQFLDKGVAQLKALYNGSVKLGRLTPGEAMRCLSMLKPTVDFTLANDVDIVSLSDFLNQVGQT